MNTVLLKVSAIIFSLVYCGSLHAAPLPSIPPPNGPDAVVGLTGTTAAAEPVLKGVVVSDELKQLDIGDFKGTLQVRVARSMQDNCLTFAYRIINKSPSGENAPKVAAFYIHGKGFEALQNADVNYRIDGLGSIAPNEAVLKKAGTGLSGDIGFLFQKPIAPGEQSRFFFVRTSLKDLSKDPARLEVVVSHGSNSGSASENLQPTGPQPAP